MSNETRSKKCGMCKVEKPLEEFYNNKAHSDGKHNYCKQCHSEYVKQRAKTPEGKNQPSKLKGWAEGMMSRLHLTDNDY